MVIIMTSNLKEIEKKIEGVQNMAIMKPLEQGLSNASSNVKSTILLLRKLSKEKLKKELH